MILISKKPFYYFLSLFVIFSCTKQKDEPKHWIGYLDPDETLFSEGFETCEDTLLYNYNSRASRIETLAGYHGGNRAIKRYVDVHWDSSPYNDSGYLTFRFIMNCKGEVGRFEVKQVDLQFEKCQFNKRLVDEILDITYHMPNWKPLCFKDENKDVFMFLTYKLINGEIVEILP